MDGNVGARSQKDCILQDPENQPRIELGDDSLYKAAGAWDDLSAAIHNARHLIYITGASKAACQLRSPQRPLR